jgi:ssDNA-binding Zn-finger/Zn-ribbon topoisomerase 1
VKAKKEDFMDEQQHTIGERADKLCAVCKEERGHIVTSVTKHGHISRVNCPKCGTLSTFKRAARTSQRPSAQPGAPYDRTHLYRAGQTMTHSTYGQGEVMSLVEPQKIDVLFSDRMRRLIHARTEA